MCREQRPPCRAIVGDFHNLPEEQVIVWAWHDSDRGSGADGPVLHWPCIPAPCWGSRRAVRRLPERRVSHWHPGIEPCQVLACTHLRSMSPHSHPASLSSPTLQNTLNADQTPRAQACLLGLQRLKQQAGPWKDHAKWECKREDSRLASFKLSRVRVWMQSGFILTCRRS